MPCPRCGSANGVTAVACWQCDLELNPEPPPVRRTPLPPPVLEEDVPVVESDVPPVMIEQIRARAAAAVDQDGPRTLPPFAPPHDAATANDPLFAAAEAPATTAKASRLMLAVAGLTLAGAVAGWLLWSSEDGPANDGRSAIAEPILAKPAKRAEPVAAPAATVTAAPAPNAAPPTVAKAAPPPAVAPQPAAPTVAKAAPPPAIAPQLAAPKLAEAPPPAVAPVKTVRASVRPAVPMTAPRPPQRQPAPLLDAPAGPAPAVRPPPPVQVTCTPQIAALALCTLEPR